jgi:hypothetical protein
MTRLSADDAIGGHVPAEARKLLELQTLDLRTELLRRVEVDDLPKDVAAACVSRLWRRAAPRQRTLIRDEDWRALWAASGFAVHGRPTQRPEESLLLFRGASAESRRGWCWTDDRQIAVSYATGFGRRRWEYVSSRCLWAALVPPTALCARQGHLVDPDGYAVSDEWIVDPAGLPEPRPWTAEEIEAAPASGDRDSRGRAGIDVSTGVTIRREGARRVVQDRVDRLAREQARAHFVRRANLRSSRYFF